MCEQDINGSTILYVVKEEAEEEKMTTTKKPKSKAAQISPKVQILSKENRITKSQKVAISTPVKKNPSPPKVNQTKIGSGIGKGLS